MICSRPETLLKGSPKVRVSAASASRNARLCNGLLASMSHLKNSKARPARSGCRGRASASRIREEGRCEAVLDPFAAATPQQRNVFNRSYCERRALRRHSRPLACGTQTLQPCRKRGHRTNAFSLDRLVESEPPLVALTDHKKKFVLRVLEIDSPYCIFGAPERIKSRQITNRLSC